MRRVCSGGGRLDQAVFARAAGSGRSGRRARSRRIEELVDRAHLDQREAAVDQGARVAGEALGRAGGVDHARHGSGQRLAHLLEGARARRVEHGQVEVLELGRLQRAAGEVALLHGDPAEPAAAAARSAAADAASPSTARTWAAARGEREGQRAHAGEQVDRPPAPCAPLATASARAASPKRSACRKAPGGGSTATAPKPDHGRRGSTIGSGGPSPAPSSPGRGRGGRRARRGAGAPRARGPPAGVQQQVEARVGQGQAQPRRARAAPGPRPGARPAPGQGRRPARGGRSGRRRSARGGASRAAQTRQQPPAAGQPQPQPAAARRRGRRAPRRRPRPAGRGAPAPPRSAAACGRRRGRAAGAAGGSRRSGRNAGRAARPAALRPGGRAASPASPAAALRRAAPASARPAGPGHVHPAGRGLGDAVAGRAQGAIATSSSADGGGQLTAPPRAPAEQAAPLAGGEIDHEHELALPGARPSSTRREPDTASLGDLAARRQGSIVPGTRRGRPASTGDARAALDQQPYQGSRADRR